MPGTNWRELHKKEATQFVADFYRASYDWRSQSYHANWDKYERNFNSIYDPNIKAKKESWQATMFDPMTVTNVEVVTSALTKINVGKKRILSMEPREMGDELQAELNTKILDYQIDKSDFALQYYDTQKEACIYGDGFMKFYFFEKYAPVRLQKPVYEGVLSAIKNFRKPGRITGFKEKVETVPIARHVKAEKIHIRDIFLEPNSTDMGKVIHRLKVTYGELKRMADQDLVDKDSVAELWKYKESDNFEIDIATVMFDMGIVDANIPKPSFGKKHTLWEFWGDIPKKWTDEGLDMPEDTEEEQNKANELIAGKILTASGKWYLGSEVNPNQSMEPPFLKLPYIRAGRTYDIGVCQLIQGIQEESNEIRNLRVDNVVLALNKVFVYLEKFISNSKDLKSSPGGLIAVKGSQVDDVRKAIMELPISDVAISAFRETGELERKAQETTGANRTTLGTVGQGGDANRTATGQELARQSAADRFTIYAWVCGRAFMVKAAQKFMELAYQNMGIEDIRRVLGEVPIEIMPGQWIPVWQAYKKQAPHELVMDYDFVPVDSFAMENKAQKRQSLAADMQLIASIIPSFDPRAGIRRLLHYDDMDKEEIDEILKGIEGPVQTPMGQGQGVPSLAKPVKTGPTDNVGPPMAAPMSPAPGNPA